MTRRRFVTFALLAATLSLLLTTAVAVAADLYLHRKFADAAGLNIWGYRGPAVGSKQSNEWRLAVLGESTAFGYGVHWNEAFPVYLQEALNAPGRPPGRPISVVNLAYNNEGAYSYPFTLRDYEYLDYDGVLFYSGYNDLGLPNLGAFRHTSAVFRLTGYMPILPLVLREKAMSIRYGGRLEDAYWGRQTTFKPNIAQRASASVLETAVSITRSLETQLSRTLPPSGASPAAGDGASCGEQWAHYCGAMYQSVKLALDMGKRVLFVTQPYVSPGHIDQQTRLVAFLRQRFPNAESLYFANLGEAMTLKDNPMAYDGVHLTAEGNRVIAKALAPHIPQLLQ